MDRNLWHISYEGGILEDPWQEPPEDMFILTRSPQEAPDTPEYVEIEFQRGVPVAVDGQRLPLVELIQQLNRRAGLHGVGRVDIVENRLVGMKSRGVYETPGGTLLYVAHQALEELTLDRDTLHFKQAFIAPRYAQLVYNGQWFTSLREALDAFVDSTQRFVTGRVRLKLYKGSCTLVGRTSPATLYRHDLATFGADTVYNQADATGFIRLFGLPVAVEAYRRQMVEEQEASRA